MTHFEDHKERRIINEKTLVPVSLIVILLGGVSWLSYIAFRTESNAQAVERIEQKQDTISVIQGDILVIKTKLEAIEETLRERKEKGE